VEVGGTGVTVGGIGVAVGDLGVGVEEGWFCELVGVGLEIVPVGVGPVKPMVYLLQTSKSVRSMK